MPVRARLWEVTPDGGLQDIPTAKLDLEERLESWIERGIGVISDDLLVIGRQVETSYGGIIDLLCIDRDGSLSVIELKRDKTPREITAQTLDYASWVKDLSRERIVDVADHYLKDRGPLEQAFARRFGTELPETLNQTHQMLIVASQIDPSTERIITYLSDGYGVPINAVTFQFFRTSEGREVLARVFLLEPSTVEERANTAASSKRLPALSRDELQEIATANGVGELYESLVRSVERKFPTARTNRSALSFVGRIDGHEQAILNLIPRESSAESGVRFQVYTRRLAALFGKPEQEIDALLPAHREPWSYYPTAPPDMFGYAGFFADEAGVQRFTAGLQRQ